MTIDTTAIRARAEKATPGPWKFNDNGVVTADHSGKIVCCFVMDFARIPDGEDWEFLEHARADIPALCDEIDRLRAERDGLIKSMNKAVALLSKDSAAKALGGKTFVGESIKILRAAAQKESADAPGTGGGK